MADRLFILDGDWGVDDALATLYLAAEPGIRILAAGSVHGNTEAHLAARNAITVLDLVGLTDVPVAVGAARPLAQPLSTSAQVHGADGLGGAAPPPRPDDRPPVSSPAAVQLIDMLGAHPHACTILATGPLTNLALALLLEPGLPDLVERVVVMGGALEASGNIDPYTEANFAHDPEAADLVLRAGWPLTLVGLDVTMQTWIEQSDLDRLERAATPAARFATAVLPQYVASYERRHGRHGCALHDPSAARIAVEPDLARYLEAPARVELRSPATRGMLLVDRRVLAPPPGPGERPIRIAIDVDGRATVDGVIDRLVGGAG